MLKKTTTIALLTLTVAGAGLLQQCGNKKKPTKPDGYAEVTSDTCTCETSWFPHDSVSNPEEGVGSPFDTSSTTNCIFHQWSWQKFLWLTKPTANGHVLFMDSLTQVNAAMIPVTPVSTYPTINLVLEDTKQAGSSGVLTTNPAASNNNTSYTVYYSIHVDPTLMDASVQYKQQLLADTNLLNNEFTFPVHSLELKVSWVDINAIPTDQQASYYTTDAVIDNGTSKVQTRVALLGMHVVGRVINHPEFIWATFEHDNMGPNYDWSTTTTSSDSPISSSSDLLLFGKGTTTTMAGITWNNNQPDSLYRVFTLFQYGVPRSAGNAFMSGTSQSEPINYDNIDGLNICAKSGLGSDVWSNYFYNGSIWLNTDGLSEQQQAHLIDSIGYSIGNVTTGSYARGSLNVFNLTMETYVQTFGATINEIHNINTGNLANCFSCHTGPSTSVNLNHHTYTSPLYVSHVFRNFMTTTSENEAKKNGIRDYLRVVKLMQTKNNK